MFTPTFLQCVSGNLSNLSYHLADRQVGKQTDRQAGREMSHCEDEHCVGQFGHVAERARQLQPLMCAQVCGWVSYLCLLPRTSTCGVTSGKVMNWAASGEMAANQAWQRRHKWGRLSALWTPNYKQNEKVPRRSELPSLLRFPVWPWPPTPADASSPFPSERRPETCLIKNRLILSFQDQRYYFFRG